MNRAPYFAYGSNLNAEDRRRWCARRDRDDFLGRAIGLGFLPDAELAFNCEAVSRQGGVLNIKGRLGQLIPGVLFEVKDGGWELADLKEDVPRRCRRRSVKALTEEGGIVGAVTYEAAPGFRTGFVAPTPEYVEIVGEGLRDFRLSDEMLNAAAQGLPAPWTVDGLFVYGTLMRGECRHRFLEDASRLLSARAAEAPGRLFDLGEFPGLAGAETPGQRVRGEYYRVQDIGRAVEVLDRVEDFRGCGGEGSLYSRVLTRVDVDGGGSPLAWTYRLSSVPGSASVIASGSWRER